MTVLLTIFIIALISSIVCLSIALLHFFRLNKLLSEDMDKVNNEIINLHIELSSVEKEINVLKKNPPEFTNRFSMIDFRLKKMEDVLSTFNNGFKYQETWMR